MPKQMYDLKKEVFCWYRRHFFPTDFGVIMWYHHKMVWAVSLNVANRSKILKIEYHCAKRQKSCEVARSQIILIKADQKVLLFDVH